MTRNVYETAGADQAREDLRIAMATPYYWRRPDIRLPADPEHRKHWLAGYAETITALLAQYVTEPAHAGHKAQPKYGTISDRDDNPVPRGTSEDMFPLYASCETCGEPARCLDITADWGHDSEWPARYRFSHPVTPAERWLIRQARAWIADTFSDVDVADLDDGMVENGVVAHYDGGWAVFMATEFGIPAAFPAMAYIRDAAGDLTDAILVYSAGQWTGLALRQPAGFTITDG